MGMDPRMMEMDAEAPATGMGPGLGPPGLPGMPPQGPNAVPYPPGFFEAGMPSGSDDLTSPAAGMDASLTTPTIPNEFTPEAMGALGMPMPGTGTYFYPGGFAPPVSGYPVMDVSGDALSALTTPVAYFTRHLPLDSFSDLKTRFWYINYVEIMGKDSLMTDGGRARRYLLLSFGPDTDQTDPTLPNPVRGPFMAYDPTNGTVSQGDLFRFGY